MMWVNDDYFDKYEAELSRLREARANDAERYVKRVAQLSKARDALMRVEANTYDEGLRDIARNALKETT